MLDFQRYVPVRIIFGKDTHRQVGKLIAELGKSRVLVAYGGKFAKASGLLDTVLSDLAAEGITTVELDGIQPNPRMSKVYEGIKLCRENDLDFILSVGGGSVLDSCKAIAGGVLYDGDAWDFFKGSPVTAALPLGDILTIPATGSEANCGGVLTLEDGWLKRGFGSPVLFPVFSILNPELTFSLPDNQTAAGLADMYTHVAERYFSNTPETYAIDAQGEAVFRSLVEVGPKLLRAPKDYNLRSEAMWLGTIAHDDTVGVGREQDWATHGMGHEVSGIYDVTHGVTMAIILLSWMKYVYKHDPDRFVRYGKYVYGLETYRKDREDVALEAIAATEAYFKSIGLPVRLSEVGVDSSRLEEMAEKATTEFGGQIGGFVKLDKDDVLKIYQQAL